MTNLNVFERPDELVEEELILIGELAKYLLDKKCTINEAIKKLKLETNLTPEALESYLVICYSVERCIKCKEWKHSNKFDHGNFEDGLEVCIDCYNAC